MLKYTFAKVAVFLVLFFSLTPIVSAKMLVDDNTLVVEEVPEFSQSTPWYKKIPHIKSDSFYQLTVNILESLNSPSTANSKSN